MIKTISTILFSILFLTPCAIGEEAITKKDSKDILSYLSSDDLEGRGVGKNGNWKASRFIAKKFKEYGLEPIDPPVYIQPVPLPPTIDGDGYFQHFNYSYSVRAGLFRRRTVSIKSANVVGILRGKTNKCILLGAHLDHLGVKGGKIYNGADDNASGIAALLEIAEAFSVTNDARNKEKPEYTLIFAAFNAEEVGLVGSKYYVNHPYLSIKDHRLMINMDMVGRMNQKILSLQCGNLSKKTKKIIDDLDNNYPFDFNLIAAGRRSDHAYFGDKGVPILFFHTGSHPQYHQPTDDEHLINYDGLTLLSKFIFQFTNSFMREQKRG